MDDNEKTFSLAAAELGKRGGKKTAERGPEYYAEIQAKREKRGGGRPKNPPQATHVGELHIGDLVIPCAVLADGRRVLSQRGVGRVLGRGRGGKDWKRQAEWGGGQLPFFLMAKNLRPFISKELALAGENPIVYRIGNETIPSHGLDATDLPQVCDVWLKAREAGVLTAGQIPIAARAEILMRGLAHTGIIALVDEATGYQYSRTRDALQEVLEKFIASEFRKWVKTFPDEFYRELFRLRKWPFKEDVVRKTPLVGKLTLDLVYDRLAPGVRQRLEEVNPKNERGRRKHKLFQRLTEDVGDPSLRAHLASVITLMKVNDDWEAFIKMMNRALPRYPSMPLFDHENTMAIAGQKK
ncbi:MULTISPECIES: P63C domain-containing protein [Acidobacterium]|uniref:Bacteriophage Mx8 p63 C-terminal domain-containing protein n=1 Tax=Acidobacterium capsulatum (strain ATCC 51196 / DSM 11244 / BCRC 80197 / JCM 7670 / NBRC 15755 / NCIMB 13165 / 161) TaxID=240015 RepID=C1F693_ACIC5|nr:MULTISPECIES: P63C domain-containing protein [Acidobacterium]ACO33987.1 conserved hypothetical protein [Acidobacterium capsulatum ATCC 51196]HCT61146.1 hypothetical protein [Acidobacterium sp.]